MKSYEVDAGFRNKSSQAANEFHGQAIDSVILSRLCVHLSCSTSLGSLHVVIEASTLLDILLTLGIPAGITRIFVITPSMSLR